LHARAIRIEGFLRTDGLFDIEARLVDTKDRGFSTLDRGTIEPDEPLHEMLVRVTVDDTMLIVAAEAVTEHGPFAICPGGAASYASLVGLRIRPGFLKEATQRLGGTVGCTHLRELLQQIGTTAFQTTWPLRAKRGQEPGATRDASTRLIDTCFGYDSTGPVVKRRWPHLYRGPDAQDAAQLAATGSAAG
jgi:hypothetical protein